MSCAAIDAVGYSRQVFLQMDLSMSFGCWTYFMMRVPPQYIHNIIQLPNAPNSLFAT